jgi:hypothetical protein
VLSHRRICSSRQKENEHAIRWFSPFSMARPGQSLAWAPPSISYGVVSNGQVNGGCGGTWTAVGAAVTDVVAVAVPPLLLPVSANTSLPWALPGMTYDPAEAALPLSSVRKQLTSVGRVGQHRPVDRHRGRAFFTLKDERLLPF